MNANEIHIVVSLLFFSREVTMQLVKVWRAFFDNFVHKSFLITTANNGCQSTRHMTNSSHNQVVTLY